MDPGRQHPLAAFPIEPLPVELSSSDYPYQCPGEPAPISEGVHLSRLATFYSKCRHCSHRTEMARLSPSLRAEWERIMAQAAAESLFRRNGVRGRAHSDWTPREATQLAAAYLAVLAEVIEVHRGRSSRPSSAVRVVLGYDTRAESPEFAVAMARTLRQHGAELIDLGWTTRPRVEQRLRTSGAGGAVFVTGAGCESGWTGADLMGPDGIIWSREGILDLVEERFHTLVPRPVREAGPHHAESATDDSFEAWAREFHGLRPLKIRVCPAEFLQRELLEQVRTLVPGLEISSQEPRDATATPGRLLDATFEWGEESRACRVLDGQGGLVSNETLAFQFGALLLDDHPHVDVVLPDAIFKQWGRTVSRCGPGYLVFHQGGTTEEQLRRTMESLRAPLGLDGADRYWVRREGQVVCDSLLTMALALQVLSRSDGAVANWTVPAA